MRILGLGDSYTIGEAVSAAERWPHLLAALLRSRGLALAEPTLLARTGWTTDELLAGIEAAELQPPYDLVTLLIGVNDQYRGRPAEQYREGFEACLRAAVRLAGGAPGRAVVLSIPDYSVTPFVAGRDTAAIREALERYNRINLDVTRAAGARYVEITAISRRVVEDPLLLAVDGLHPSGVMHAQWARCVLPVVLEALKERGRRPVAGA